MEKKEEKAKEYALNMYQSYTGYDKFDIQEAYKTGYDEALKSLWVKVEDSKPELYQKVLAMIIYKGSIQIHSTMYLGDKEWRVGDCRIIAWMPIPSFDEILEANKDVLQRLKDK